MANCFTIKRMGIILKQFLCLSSHLLMISTGALMPEAITNRHVISPISQLLALLEIRDAAFWSETSEFTMALTAFRVRVVIWLRADEPITQPISSTVEIVSTERSIRRVTSNATFSANCNAPFCVKCDFFYTNDKYCVFYKLLTKFVRQS